tara:strand:+ start:17038 stop:18183 length:1146 start_codon:yes stop_codon:yes gene_type:complete
MAFVLKDRVKETTTTTGTGAVSLDGEAGGFQDFSSAIGNTNTTYYAIVHQSLDEWEVGIGTYGSASNNLTRTTLLSSSTGSAVNFSAGTKDVFVTLPASEVVHTSASPSFTNVSISGTLTVGGIVSVGGSLVGTSATFDDKVSVSALAVTGITSIGGSLVGTSATFSNHVSSSTLAVTGITSIGGSLVGTSATFNDHVSVSSMTVTGNVTATQYYGGGGNLTGVSAGIATNVSGGYAVLTSAQISGNVSIGGGLYVHTSVGIGVASPLGQIHIAKNAIADIVSLTDAANVSLSFSNGQNFSLTLAGNRTLDNPTQCVPGQVGSIFIIQDGTGGRTLSYGTNWEFPAATAPTLSTSAAAVDRLDYIVRTSTAVQSVLSKEYS